MSRGVLIDKGNTVNEVERLIKVFDYLNRKGLIIECGPVNAREAIGLNVNAILFDWKFFSKFELGYEETANIMREFQREVLSGTSAKNPFDFWWFNPNKKQKAHVRVTAHLKCGHYKILTFKEVPHGTN